MPHGSSKHLTKKERKALLAEKNKGKRMSKEDREALQAEITDVEGEPFATVKGLRILFNALIDDGSGTLERGMAILQALNDRLDKPRTIMPCSFCGKKLGLKQCSGCSNHVRYCSRQCVFGTLVSWLP